MTLWETDRRHAHTVAVQQSTVRTAKVLKVPSAGEAADDRFWHSCALCAALIMPLLMLGTQCWIVRMLHHTALYGMLCAPSFRCMTLGLVRRSCVHLAIFFLPDDTAHPHKILRAFVFASRMVLCLGQGFRESQVRLRRCSVRYQYSDSVLGVYSKESLRKDFVVVEQVSCAAHRYLILCSQFAWLQFSNTTPHLDSPTQSRQSQNETHDADARS